MTALITTRDPFTIHINQKDTRRAQTSEIQLTITQREKVMNQQTKQTSKLVY